MLNYSLKSKPSIKDLKLNTLIEVGGNEYNVSSNSIGRHYIDNVALTINTLNHIDKFEITKFQIEKGIRNKSKRRKIFNEIIFFSSCFI